ncbi:MAG: hypothetical protein DRP09_17635, partial [Candidatus Thorarchaeota archaeon]
MDENEVVYKLKRLKDELRRAMLLLPLYERGERADKTVDSMNRVCSLLFKDMVYPEIWDEGILLQLERLFQTISPNESHWGEHLKRIGERTTLVKQVNDFFFAFIDKDSSADEILECLSLLIDIPDTAAAELRSTQQLSQIRRSKEPTHMKIKSFVNYLTHDLSLNLGKKEEGIRAVFAWLEERESSAGPNALLVHKVYGSGTAVPLQIQLHDGNGGIKCLVPGCEHFEKAIERAKEALIAVNLIRQTRDVAFSLNITEAQYLGDSIALAAAMGMYAKEQGIPIDPYTAFTGNVNLEGEKYRITAIKGIDAKLEAARLAGCRRVFVPQENQPEITPDNSHGLNIHPVNTILDVLQGMQKPNDPLPEESLQERKICLLRSYCTQNGWHLSEPRSIQAALQFTISPPHPPELTVNIYNTGSHTPKKTDNPDLQKLLDGLNKLDQLRIPIQSINENLLVKDEATRTFIQKALDALNPTSQKSEQYCKFSYTFQAENEKVIIKQYDSGKLIFQGRAGELYHKILSTVVTTYNRNHPGANLSVDEYIKFEIQDQASTKRALEKTVLQTIAFPHIGTDESGKGDYFGPMVVAGVWTDESQKNKLENLGVRDSKQLSDKRCRELAGRIRELCRGRYHVVELSPAKYNTLYEDFKKEGKNLNHLLAWGHARAIESLLEKRTCSCAIADQFGDEHYILSKLMDKGKKVELVQTHKG